MPRIARLALLVVGGLCLAPAASQAERPRFHLEVDPLPFALGGYGIQFGIADPVRRIRLGVGNFSLEVPDALAQLRSDNDGFHVKVRRSHALYGLYFFDALRGWCVGGSIRYLRLEYTLDGADGQRARLGELALEAIGGYKWHPFKAGFYIMPWIALGVPLHTTADRQIADRTYKADPVGVFATANIGWQF